MYCKSTNCESRDYFYELVGLTVAMDAHFLITSDSGIDTVGYIYLGSFDPENPDTNMISFDHNSGERRKFAIVALLECVKNYTFLITTFSRYQTGPFSITVTGASEIAFMRRNVSSKLISMFHIQS
jgi:hypothetical protein